MCIDLDSACCCSSSCSGSRSERPPGEPVLLLGGQWQLPLVFVILLSFAAGALLGVTATFASLLRKHREIRRLRRQVERMERGQAEPVAPAVDALPPSPSDQVWKSNSGGCSRCRFLRARLAGRTHRHPSGGQESRALPRSYLNGLNFLLNEQPIRRSMPSSRRCASTLRRSNCILRSAACSGAVVADRASASINCWSIARISTRAAPAGAERARAGLPQGRVARPCRGGVLLRDTRADAVALQYLLEIYQQRRTGPAIGIARPCRITKA